MAIAAIATAHFNAAIGIVRVSGADAISISNSITDIDLHLVKPRTATLCNIHNIDRALVIVFRAPNSYTGDNLVEFHCHGGTFILSAVLDLLLQNGCNLADRGDFTKQAFLNGKLSINQAQAVMDIIQAKTSAALSSAYFNLQHDFFNELASDITNVVAHCHAVTDFQLDDFDLAHPVNVIIAKIDNALSNFNQLKVLRDGLNIAIVGKPNVGKSTLFNHLVKQNRAIVSDVPGTTRDSIDATIDLRGYPVTFHDTAGVHLSNNLIESIGINRTRDIARTVDLVIAVFDSSTPLDDNDRDVLNFIDDKPNLRVLSKADLPTRCNLDNAIAVSVIANQGLDTLADFIYNFIGNLNTQAPLVRTVAQINSLRNVQQHLINARNLPLDIAAFELNTALNLLKLNPTDDVINSIFENFCIGK